MSNMSYCKFQNTVSDFQECVDEFVFDELSPEEKKASKRLYKLAKEYIQEYEFQVGEE